MIQPIDIQTIKDKVRVGEEFISDIVLNNIENIYAEDIKITYNTKLFEYVGYENIPGLKVYHIVEEPEGILSFIIASQGKDNSINESETLVKLKFWAKAPGNGKIDIIAGRIANINEEWDIAEENCGEKNIIVESSKDVNRDGEFTLLDLAIDAYYLGFETKDTDTTKYDADVLLDGTIHDGDLMSIVEQILSNANYKPNN